MMKVGRSSCSRSSTMPTDPSRSSPDCWLLRCLVEGILLFSTDATFPGIFVERWGQALPMLPRASFSVVIPPESSRIVFRIAAAMVWEVEGQDSGEEGELKAAVKCVERVSGPNVCRRPNCGRLFFRGGSVKVWDLGCFKVCATVGVRSVTPGWSGPRETKTLLLDAGRLFGASRWVWSNDIVRSSRASSCDMSLPEWGGQGP